MARHIRDSALPPDYSFAGRLDYCGGGRDFVTFSYGGLRPPIPPLMFTVGGRLEAVGS